MKFRIPFSNAPHHKRIARLLERKTFVLDLGCGSGELGIFLSRSLSCECVGLDVQSQDFRGDRGLFVLADGERLPFREDVFDVVMSTHFMEHVRNCVRSLHEQIRVLKPEGRFIMCQADLLSPLTILDVVFLYPLRSRGERGGVRWLRQLGKGIVYKNYYYGLPMKMEEIHTRFYWRQLLEAAGLGEVRLPFKVLTFLGTIYVTARKSSHESSDAEKLVGLGHQRCEHRNLNRRQSSLVRFFLCVCAHQHTTQANLQLRMTHGLKNDLKLFMTRSNVNRSRTILIELRICVKFAIAKPEETTSCFTVCASSI